MVTGRRKRGKIFKKKKGHIDQAKIRPPKKSTGPESNPPKKTVLKEGWKNSRFLQTFLEDFLGLLSGPVDARI